MSNSSNTNHGKHQRTRFIAYPGATLYDKVGSSYKKIKKLLWGDYAYLRPGSTSLYQEISCRDARGWVRHDCLQLNRLLEVNFIDLGQGDGCFIVTPDDKFILIDAGQGDNMMRFLQWRFNLRKNRFVVPIEHLIISHSDKDHYNGFNPIISSSRFKIHNIWHNGIFERMGSKRLGSLSNDAEHLTDIIETTKEAKDLVRDKASRGRMPFPNLIYKALFKKGVSNLNMLKKDDTIPGYSEEDDVHMQVLGPIAKKDSSTAYRPWLKYFNKNDGETKNGHSVIIKLHYGKVKIMLGGDLNDVSEKYLAQHYTGYDLNNLNEKDRDIAIKKGREVFQCDIAKSCHHGSHKFNDDFLHFFNPVATVISSGDNETHTHPRPDTLGALGKASRGIRPLIFSTELARSNPERKVIDDELIDTLAALNKEIRNEPNNTRRKELQKTRKSLKYELERNVAVYGMINVRTDGEKILIAQKKEQKGAGFIYWMLNQNSKGEFEYIHDH